MKILSFLAGNSIGDIKMDPLTLLLQQVDRMAHNNELIMKRINVLESHNQPIDFENMDYACHKDTFSPKKENHKDIIACTFSPKKENHKDIIDCLNVLKNMNDEAEEKLKRKRLAQYIVENNLFEKHPLAKNPKDIFCKNKPRINLVNILSKVTIPFPLIELMKIPSLYEKVRNFFINHQVNVPPQDMNIMNDSNHVYPNHWKTSNVTPEKMRETKRDIDNKALKKSIIDTLDEETKERIRETKFEEFQRRNKNPPRKNKPSVRRPHDIQSHVILTKVTVPSPLSNSSMKHHIDDLDES